MRTVAIIGTGLIGGSFGLGLRAAGFTGEIVGVSSAPAIEAALQVGAIDRRSTLAEAAAQADLIFLSQPVLRIINTLGELAGKVRRDALITDGGSTKVAITRAASQHFADGAFIGGHPMAGSERSGAEAASADLFRNRPWVFTPANPADMDTPRAMELLRWIERLGARVMVMDAAAHDRTVALTSHLPQLISTALAASVQPAEGAACVCGPGLVDMTRLAMSPYEVWHDILVTNREFVGEALQLFLEKLTLMKDGISSDEPELRDIFQSAQRLAASLRGLGGG